MSANRQGRPTGADLAGGGGRIVDALLRFIPVSVITTDLQRQITNWNDASEALYGWPAADAVGQDVRGRLVERDPERARGIMQSVLAGTPWRGEFHTAHRDGRPLTVELTVAPLLDAGGQVVGTIGASLDLAERRTAARALEIAETRFRALYEASVIGIVTGEGDHIQTANDGFLRMLGYRRAELDEESLDWRALTPPEWEEANNRAIADVLERGSGQPFEKEYLHHDGHRVPVLVGTVAITPDPFTWIAFVLDLSEQRRLEAERDRVLRLEQEARARAEQASLRAVLVAAVSTSLGRALTVDDVAGVAVGQAAEVLGASGGTVALAEARSVALRTVATSGLPDAAAVGAAVLGDGTDAPAAEAMRTGDPVTVASLEEADARGGVLADAMRAIGAEAMVVLPLMIEGRHAGVVAWTFSGPVDFTEDDRTILRLLANQCSQALERALLYEREQHVSQTLQASLLPGALPPIPGIDLAALYRPIAPGADIGGDFYDVISLSRDRWGIVVGDVCGKGAEAAALTALARHTVRAAAVRGDGPVEVCRWVDRMVRRREPADGRFVTLVYGELVQAGDDVRLSYVCAGHPPPLRVTPAGEVEELPAYGGLLGVMGPPELRVEEVVLAPGDLVVLYTDGVTDTPRDGTLAGEQRLADLLSGCATTPAAQVCDLIQRDATPASGSPAQDDIAVLALRVDAG
jgi:PAS domain S-box-containing protein